MKDLTAIDASKIRISEALIELMRSQDFHSVTITDLVEQARISRATFYRHFDSKEAVLHYYFDRMIERYHIADHLAVGSVDDYYRSIKFVLDVIKKNKLTLSIVVRANFGSIILKYIDERYTRPYRNAGADKVPLYVYIFSGGIYNVVIKWLEEDCQTSAEELARSIVAVTPCEFIRGENPINVNEG